MKDHPPFKFFISISGTKFRTPSICEVAYKESIKAKSVHFIGEKDRLKLPSEELATTFQDPLIIRHPQGHTVPRLGIPFLHSGRYIIPQLFKIHLYTPFVSYYLLEMNGFI